MTLLNRTRLIGLVTGVLAVPAVLAAAPTYLNTYSLFLQQKPMEVMHMMDKGNKGYVTRDEFMAFHEEMFKRMDKNGDGKISVEEWLGRELRKSDGAS